MKKIALKKVISRKRIKNLHILFLMLSFVFALYISLFMYAKFVKQRRISSMKVLGVSSRIVPIGVDYSNKVSKGSPLVFGGVHAPSNNDYSVWQDYSDIGITLVRSDFFVEFCVPQNITLEQYKNNVNDIQNPHNWPGKCLSNIQAIFSQAKKRKMTVVGVLAYMPKWLSENNDSRSLPKDWQVYEDIVSKLYRLNRDNLDYIEIWNEPDHPEFFTISADESKERKYLEIFKHATRAIRSVDSAINDGKRIKIGGPSISCPCETSYLQELLNDNEARAELDYISIHSYNNDDKYLSKIKKIMQEKEMGSLPIYISEWNKSSLAKIDSDYNKTYLAVPYTAERLVTFLKNNIPMASYFSLRENIPSSSLPERRSYGFYKRVWNGYQLFPQSSVWRLMSRKLKLGEGESTIVSSDPFEKVDSLGYINKDGESGLILINPDKSATADFTAYGAPFVGQETDIEISMITSQGYESAYCSDRFKPDSDTIHFQFNVPENSVVAVHFSPAHLSVNNVLKILAISTARDCLEFN